MDRTLNPAAKAHRGFESHPVLQYARVAQLAEASVSNAVQCEFESHREYHNRRGVMKDANWAARQIRHVLLSGYRTISTDEMRIIEEIIQEAIDEAKDLADGFIYDDL